MNKKLFLLSVLFMIIAITVAGCSGGATEAADNGGQGGEQAPTDTAPPETTDGSTEPEDGGLSDPAGDLVPEDVPVLDGAYNLDVIRGGTQIDYTVDTDVETAMALLQEALTALGWMETRSPDTAMGNIGLMTRANEAKDTLSVNLSYNGNGGFTNISIAISRESQ